MKAFQFLQELGKRMSGRNRQGGTGNIESLAEIKLPLDVLFLVMDLSDDQTLHTWALVNKQLWKLSGHVIDTVLDERMLLRIAERIQSQPFVWHEHNLKTRTGIREIESLRRWAPRVGSLRLLHNCPPYAVRLLAAAGAAYFTSLHSITIGVFENQHGVLPELAIRVGSLFRNVPSWTLHISHGGYSTVVSVPLVGPHIRTSLARCRISRPKEVRLVFADDRHVTTPPASYLERHLGLQPDLEDLYITTPRDEAFLGRTPAFSEMHSRSYAQMIVSILGPLAEQSNERNDAGAAPEDLLPKVRRVVVTVLTNDKDRLGRLGRFRNLDGSPAHWSRERDSLHAHMASALLHFQIRRGTSLQLRLSSEA